MEVQTGRYTVTIREMTWWQAEEIKAMLASGTKLTGAQVDGIDGKVLLEANMKALENCVVKIVEGDKDVPFTQDWVKQLTQTEGETLKEAIDNLGKKK